MTARSLGWLTGWDIDDWGRDDTLAGVAARLGHLRWDATIGGAEVLPERGPALIVVNSRRFALAPWFVALALSQRTGRPVRFVGRPDTAPFGALARRLGGLLARPDEVARRAPARSSRSSSAPPGNLRRSTRRIDRPPPDRTGAWRSGCRSSLVPSRCRSRRGTPGSRSDAPIKPSRRRRGPLAEFELTAQVADRIDEMLSEFGDARTGTPLDWLPLNPFGDS